MLCQLKHIEGENSMNPSEQPKEYVDIFEKMHPLNRMGFPPNPYDRIPPAQFITFGRINTLACCLVFMQRRGLQAIGWNRGILGAYLYGCQSSRHTVSLWRLGGSCIGAVGIDVDREALERTAFGAGDFYHALEF